MADLRARAIKILERIEANDAWAAPLLEARGADLEPRDRAWMRERVFGVLRRKRRLDAVLAELSGRDPEALDAPVRQTLRLGLYEIRCADAVPDYAAVSGAVDALRARRAGRAAGLVNAVLRRAIRSPEIDVPPAVDAASLALRGSHPDVWVERLVARDGLEGAHAVVEANQSPAPTFFRLAVEDADEAAALSRTLEDEVGIVTASIDGMPFARRHVSGSWRGSAAFAAGLFAVQDLSSQAVGALLDPRSGDRALDLCAAPGGKALDLAQRGARVVAGDLREERTRRLRRRLERDVPGRTATIRHDGTRPCWPTNGGFDAVLLDAPCSGSGTFRKRPEARDRFSIERLAELATLQGTLLAAAADAVAPGGRLVYAVCSLEPEEGPEIVEAFLQSHPDFRAVDAASILEGEPANDVRHGAYAPRPRPDGGEGFFAARLARE